DPGQLLRSRLRRHVPSRDDDCSSCCEEQKENRGPYADVVHRQILPVSWDLTFINLVERLPATCTEFMLVLWERPNADTLRIETYGPDRSCNRRGKPRGAAYRGQRELRYRFR